MANRLASVVALLDDPAPDVRRAAATALSVHVEQSEVVLSALVRASGRWTDDDTQVALLLAGAVIAASTPPVSNEVDRWFQHALRAPDGGRMRAAAAIGCRNVTWPRRPDDPVVVALAAATAQPAEVYEPWIEHGTAVYIVGSLLLDWTDLHGRMASASGPSDDEVRFSAVAETGRCLRAWRGEHRAHLSVLDGLLHDRQAEVAEAAAVQLSWAGRLTAIVADSLVDVMGDADSSRRARASILQGLARIGDERCIPWLVPELREPKLVAAIGPAILGMEQWRAEVMDAVADYLSTPQARTIPARTNSVLSAVAAWPESHVLLDRALGLSDVPELQVAVAELCGAAGSAGLSALKVLDNATDGSSPTSVRLSAAWALWRVTDDWSLSRPVFAELLRNDDSTSVEVARWVPRVGPHAADLSTPLLDLQSRLDDWRAAVAAAALISVGRSDGAEISRVQATLREKRELDLLLGVCAAHADVATSAREVLTTIAEASIHVAEGTQQPDH
jgi:hypothetical protein